MGCLDTNTVLAFVDGRLEGEALSDAERHLAGCPICADLVGDAAGAEPRGAAPPATPARLVKGAAIGRYVILDLVGRGGMGEVYAAYDPQLDRKVALKLLHEQAPAGASVAQARARLLREAKAIARLSHPHVVTVHDAGEIEDRVFLAMEFVDGQTLAAWLAAAPRSWLEIRDVFLAAGEGLAAAHQAGLVHRDFKPQNVMVGRDGSVRVMDFGLASAPEPVPVTGAPAKHAASQAPGGGAVAPETAALTRTGLLIGTPLYMAPEQFLARNTDPRTDQFSFCVALWEAVHGERPFPSESLAALAEAVINGRIREPAQKTRAPAFVRKLLLRGLRPDPAHRWASMRALLEALQRDPARRRRRLALGGALIVAAVAVAAGSRRLAAPAQPLCQGAGGKLAETWELAADGSRRTALHRAFLATRETFAEETWRRVSSVLDDYGRRWTAMYTDACEATHVRGDQSAEVLDLRMSCLDRSLGAVRALAEVFAGADRAILVEAVNGAQALPPIDRCANVALLRSGVAPPRDPATRARVDAARGELARVKALTDTGQWTEAKRRALLLIPETRATGYGPLVAESQLQLGHLEERLGESVSAATIFEEALATALAASRDDLAAECAVLLVAELGYHLERPEEATHWERLAVALLERLGPGHDRLASWHRQHRGYLLLRRGDLPAAIAELRAALAMKQKAFPPDHPDLVFTLDAITATEIEIGNYPSALEAADKSLAIRRRAYGEGTPLLANQLMNRGEVLTLLGRREEAERDLRDSVERWGIWVGPEHHWVGHPLTALGNLLVDDGRPAEAVTVLEHALRARERGEPMQRLVAETRFALARALWDAGGDKARARSLATSARDTWRAIPGTRRLLTASETWLAQAAKVSRH